MHDKITAARNSSIFRQLIDELVAQDQQTDKRIDLHMMAILCHASRLTTDGYNSDPIFAYAVKNLDPSILGLYSNFGIALTWRMKSHDAYEFHVSDTRTNQNYKKTFLYPTKVNLFLNYSTTFH